MGINSLKGSYKTKKAERNKATMHGTRKDLEKSFKIHVQITSLKQEKKNV